MSKSRPVLVLHIVSAVLAALLASAAFTKLIGESTTGILAVALAVVNIVFGILSEQQVSPASTVVAQVVDGQVVAGPAAPQTTGTPVVVSGDQTLADVAATGSTDTPGA